MTGRAHCQRQVAFFCYINHIWMPLHCMKKILQNSEYFQVESISLHELYLHTYLDGYSVIAQCFAIYFQRWKGHSTVVNISKCRKLHPRGSAQKDSMFLS